MENLVCKFNFFKPQKTQKLYVLKVFQKKKKVKVEISNFFTFELLVFEIFWISNKSWGKIFERINFAL